MEKEITATAEYVKEYLAGRESGHGWWHVYRVWQMAKRIAREEGADLLTVELAALLHDLADYKFQTSDSAPDPVMPWLEKLHLDPKVIESISHIIDHMSYSSSIDSEQVLSKEGQIVQDADRLDALGAIGVARAFNYGGSKGREMYDPAIAPILSQNAKQYKKSTAPTINHFYEKLLLLKDKMNTDTGRELAIERHKYMQQFLDEFYAEWEGER